MNFDLVKNTILLTVAGSRAYGLATSSSDVDVKGVGIGDAKHYLSPFQNWNQTDDPNQISLFKEYLRPNELKSISSTKLEGTVYELQKFMELATNANPSILDVLFCKDSDIRLINNYGKILRFHKSLFLSAKVKHTFSGYATAQMKKITSHKLQLDSEEYKSTRNEDRKLLETRFGYNTKHAMHLVRLMRMGREILLTGIVNVDRTGIDAEELIGIRNGSWPYDRLFNYCQEMNEELDMIYDGGHYVLPHKPDIHIIEDLCVELISSKLYGY